MKSSCWPNCFWIILRIRTASYDSNQLNLKEKIQRTQSSVQGKKTSNSICLRWWRCVVIKFQPKCLSSDQVLLVFVFNNDMHSVIYIIRSATHNSVCIQQYCWTNLITFFEWGSWLPISDIEIVQYLLINDYMKIKNGNLLHFSQHISIWIFSVFNHHLMVHDIVFQHF